MLKKSIFAIATCIIFSAPAFALEGVSINGTVVTRENVAGLFEQEASKLETVSRQVAAVAPKTGRHMIKASQELHKAARELRKEITNIK